MSTLQDQLVDNSKHALFAGIEIHNKPIFPYRYQICSIMIINAWELLLKAYLSKYEPNVKIINNDGSTKPFEECLACVKSSVGNSFALEAENILRLYDFRCNCIHYYADNIDPILYSLFAKTVQLYARFLLKYFGIDLCEESHLILLPVGFKPPISPIDFLSTDSNMRESSSEVQEFIRSVIVSTESLTELGIEEPILYTFSMSLVNEQRVKNADIVAAISKESNLGVISISNVLTGLRISNDEDAKTIRIEEDSLFKTVYTLTSREVYLEAYKLFPNLKQNREYHSIMNKAKLDPNLYKFRHLDVQHRTNMGQGFYNKKILEVLGSYYNNRGRVSV